MYTKNAIKPTSGNSRVLRVSFSFGDSIRLLHPTINRKKIKLLQLYVLSISAILCYVSALGKQVIANQVNLNKFAWSFSLGYS
jgi:hypothetical protein